MGLWIRYVSVFWLLTTPVQAQEPYRDPFLNYNLFGTPGLIDLPTATSAPDAELAATVSHFAGSTRTTLSFQISDRLSGSFRYASLGTAPAFGDFDLRDRSFDLRYRLLDEGPALPALAIGLRDIMGTGVYASEYVVATKTIAPRLQFSAGIGWGRLGSNGGFANPLRFFADGFAGRPEGFTGTGGQIEAGRWFRGDAALFGGLTWRPTDAVTFMVEQSSDAYLPEQSARRDLLTPKSPLNFGLSYAVNESVSLQAHYLYGTAFGAGLTYHLNPRFPAVNGGAHQRPTPVMPRSQDVAWSTDWTQQQDGLAILRGNVARLLAFERLQLEAIAVDAEAVIVLIRNPTYLAEAEAVGRTARILARLMPPSVSQFTVVPVKDGLRRAAVRIARADIETLEFHPDQVVLSFGRATFHDAAGIGREVVIAPDLYPNLTWSVGPYLSASYFDPSHPVRADFGIEGRAKYAMTSAWQFDAVVRKRLGGNISGGRASDSVLARVRSDGPLYAAAGDLAIVQLSGRYHANLAPDVYGRLTVGYLEPMFGGLSGELLWKPVESPLGLGLELNYVRQRDFDQLFGFQDYGVWTGHASAYYAFKDGFYGQLDVGRYLAGDVGATFTLDRVFDNGWRVGAFATFTDVSFDNFGEGSFDKGLRISVPLDHFLGQPTARVAAYTLRPLSRDGGARLNVDGRLYDVVRGAHRTDLQGSWGRFWR